MVRSARKPKPAKPPVSRPDETVDRGPVGAGDVAEHALGLLDLEPWKLGRDVVGRVQEARVTRAAHALGHVQEIVSDDDERAPRRQRGRRAGEHEPVLVRRQVEVKEEDEVVRGGSRLVLDEVGLREGDLDVLALGPLSCLRDGDGRVVDAFDRPTESCEPDRVLALAAGEVERASWSEALDLRDEETVRLRAPEILDPCVAAVPILTPHAGAPPVSPPAACPAA